MDPTQSAALIGTLNRADVNAANVMNAPMLNMMRNTFGQPNMTMFTQGLTQAVETATTRGVEMTTGRTQSMATMMAGLAEFGGMSPQGALAFSGRLQARGLEAAGLTRPEDIIAFQAMRGSGMSVTDAMIAMEQDPHEVNRRVFEYLQGATGGDQDLFRMRVKSYLGAGTTMSEVDRFITTQEEMAGMSASEIQRVLEGREIGEAPGTYAVDAETAKALEIFQVRQNQMLKGFKDSMLDLTTGVTGWFQRLFMPGEGPVFDPMGFTGSYNPRQRPPADIGGIVGAVNDLTFQNVENIEAVIANADLTIQERDMTLTRVHALPTEAAAISSIVSLRDNPDFRGFMGSVYGAMNPAYREGWDAMMLSGMDPFSAGPGGFSKMFGDVITGLSGTIREEFREETAGLSGSERREKRREYEEAMSGVFAQFGGVRAFAEPEDLVNVITLLVQTLAGAGFVYTDGEWVPDE
jgi:hypothetical protein